jgi:hypothetical protein
MSSSSGFFEFHPQYVKIKIYTSEFSSSSGFFEFHPQCVKIKIYTSEFSVCLTKKKLA